MNWAEVKSARSASPKMRDQQLANCEAELEQLLKIHSETKNLSMEFSKLLFRMETSTRIKEHSQVRG